jgi:UDP-2,3-diacylglucosamine hydrolase
MQGPPIYLASDVHLGVVPPETERAFLAWLDHCGGAASQVILNGDLFDFWFEYRSAIPRGHTRTLGALAALVDAGVPVTLMGGNHDWWGGDFLTGEIGVEFLREPTRLELQGRQILLAHGDGLGSGDLGYRILKSILRGAATPTWEPESPEESQRRKPASSNPPRPKWPGRIFWRNGPGPSLPTSRISSLWSWDTRMCRSSKKSRQENTI